jgi:hypothetical protein
MELSHPLRFVDDQERSPAPIDDPGTCKHDREPSYQRRSGLDGGQAILKRFAHSQSGLGTSPLGLRTENFDAIVPS